MFMRMVYDEKLAQAAYVLGCQRTGEALVIDPERDVDRYIQLARSHGLRITAVAETHIHADFLSGARELAEGVGAKVYVSAEGGDDWRSAWLHDKPGGGSYAHHELRDGDQFRIGGIRVTAIHTPGHTPEHMVFMITDEGAGADAPIGMATGDFVFVGDLGRPDLLESAAGQAGAMEPSARRLFQSVRRLNDVPEFVQVWPGHGAGSACGKALGAVPSSTIGYERRFNPAIRAAQNEQGFIDFILSGQPEPPLYFAEMKRLNKLGPPVLGLAKALPMPQRTTLDALTRVDAKSHAIVDTRAWPAFRDGHIPFSLSLPLDRTFNTNAGSFIGLDTPIHLIVEPERLEEAVRDLLRIGLDRIESWLDPAELRSGADLATIDEVSPEEAARLIERGAGVLDVRRRTEFDDGHLHGATNIAHTRLAARTRETPDAETLVVHCQGGVRSARAAAFLRREGRNVVNLRGGYLAWTKAALPVDHEPTGSHEKSPA